MSNVYTVIQNDYPGEYNYYSEHEGVAVFDSYEKALEYYKKTVKSKLKDFIENMLGKDPASEEFNDVPILTEEKKSEDGFLIEPTKYSSEEGFEVTSLVEGTYCAEWKIGFYPFGKNENELFSDDEDDEEDLFAFDDDDDDDEFVWYARVRLQEVELNTDGYWSF